LRFIRSLAAVLTVLVLGVSVAACNEDKADHATSAPTTQVKRKDVQKQVARNRDDQSAYVPPPNNSEIQNYNNATKTYNDPNTILWCTTTWGNPSAPLITVPIKGKLTSSTTSFLSPDAFFDRGNYSWSTGSNYSVDGLYHPNPPKYRYGFTPGGQLVDFSESMPTTCTTAPTKFQRQNTHIALSVDPSLNAADQKAQAALRAGKPAEAERILSQAAGQ
jgi:hypothetical protein